MRLRLLRHLSALAFIVALAAPFLAEAQTGTATATATKTLPERLTSAEMWRLITEISEPGGYFRIVDNFTSNEPEVAQIFTMLRERNIPASVYVGVGPEQNLSYIAAVRPKFAFIIDIRRQAVVQHLMYKAIFEMSRDRADFISMLFARPRPAGLDSTTTIDKIWDAFWYVPRDTALERANYVKVVDRLTKTHAFALNADELSQLQHLVQAFQGFGWEITTNGARNSGRGGGGGGNNAHTFADLTGYEYDVQGQRQSFMSTEANYRFVKSLHEKNLIVPVSGDFGGPKALRAIGTWVKDNGGVLSAYYLSNVEQYLFMDGKAGAFYANVATLPLDDNSVFIRPYALRNSAHPLCPVVKFLAAAQAGRAPTDNAARTCPQ
jgi:hypothetical protein